jgi:hypothetical protein
MNQPMATYECLQCEAKRPYGHSTPLNHELPWLNCGDCGRTQRHSFVGIKSWAYETHSLPERDGGYRTNVEWLGVEG